MIGGNYLNLMKNYDDSALKELFDILDVDHNGYLDASEFSTAVRAIGLNPTESDIKEILEERDMDKDGVLSFQEFHDLYKLVHASNDCSPTDIVNLYKKCKPDTDGFISTNELAEILAGEGEPLEDYEIQKIIKHFDKKKLGRISLTELVNGLLH